MNHTRRVLGFDTFTGFPSVTPLDGSTAVTQAGAYSVTVAYEEHLAEVLAVKMRLGSYAHLERFEPLKGDAPEQLTQYLKKHSETMVSLAYFDLDLYEPTRACAEMLVPYFLRCGDCLRRVYPSRLPGRDSRGATSVRKRCAVSAGPDGRCWPLLILDFRRAVGWPLTGILDRLRRAGGRTSCQSSLHNSKSGPRRVARLALAAR